MANGLIKSILSIFRLSRRLEELRALVGSAEATLNDLSPKIAEMHERSSAIFAETEALLARSKSLEGALIRAAGRVTVCETSTERLVVRAEAVMSRNDKEWHKILDKLEAENRAKFVRRRYGSGAYLRHDDRGPRNQEWMA